MSAYPAVVACTVGELRNPAASRPVRSATSNVVPPAAAAMAPSNRTEPSTSDTTRPGVQREGWGGPPSIAVPTGPPGGVPTGPSAGAATKSGEPIATDASGSDPPMSRRKGG